MDYKNIVIRKAERQDVPLLLEFIRGALNKNKGCSTECLGMVAAIVTVASAACWVICLII